MEKLISYIAPAAPATRRPATGDEPYMRLEVGFTPKWYQSKLGIDFGENWHNNPEYRKSTIIAMRREMEYRFPGLNIGVLSDKPDLLTGTFGACTVAAIYGLPIIYRDDNWPICDHKPLTDAVILSLEPPDLDKNQFFQDLMKQLDWIEQDQGEILGFINWQGILNNAHRLREEKIFTDMYTDPEAVMHLMDCICNTMIDAIRRLHERQRKTNLNYQFFTVSNCLVNMISPDQYKEFIMPFDLRISREFETIGIHNCAWNADPYMESYSKFSNLGYIDMGMNSNLIKAKEYFPQARRAIMYTPMDLYNKPIEHIRQDMELIASTYAPCDIVLADVEEGTPDEKIIQLHEILLELNP